MAARPSWNLDISLPLRMQHISHPYSLAPSSHIWAGHSARDSFRGAGMKRDSNNSSIRPQGGHLPGHSASNLSF